MKLKEEDIQAQISKMASPQKEGSAFDRRQKQYAKNLKKMEVKTVATLPSGRKKQEVSNAFNAAAGLQGEKRSQFMKAQTNPRFKK